VGLSVAVQCITTLTAGFARLAESTVFSEVLFSAAATRPVQKPQLSSDALGGTVVLVLSVSLQPMG